MGSTVLNVREKIAGVAQGLIKVAWEIWVKTTDPKLSLSYYPEEETKSKPRVFAELLWWLLRHGEINHYYYVYGLDRTCVDRYRDVLPYRQFRHIRNRANMRIGRAPYNYVCVLRDKFLFAQQLTRSLDFATPRTIALLDASSITWLEDSLTRPLNSLAERGSHSVDGFCKKVGGIQGDGAFPLRLDDGRIYLRDRELTVAELASRLDERYLLQERIVQHETLNALHPSSVNTIRLITFAQASGIVLFAAAMRIGVHGKSVDNWAAGGLIVGIDPVRGELRGEGFYKPGYGGRTAKHPDSGIEFRGFKIPYFFESVDLVRRLHGFLRDIHSVGWDVAITSSGPSIIEGNDDWEGGIPMVLEKDFRLRFLAMYGRHPRVKDESQGQQEPPKVSSSTV